MNLEEIKDFLLSSSRHKLILHSELFNDIEYLDIGWVISEAIKKKVNNKNISLITKEILNQLIEEKSYNHPVFGKTIAIKNIGILLEDNLKIDFINFLENNSKITPLFIEWKGDYENNLAYFLTKEKGITFDLKHINHIYI